MFTHFLVMARLFWWFVFCNLISDSLWLDGVFLFQVRPVAEDEMFKVLRTGKRKSEYFITNYSFLVFARLVLKVESSYLSCSLNK